MIFLPSDKTNITNWFLAGKEITDIATHLGVSRRTIETVIREGMTHLMEIIDEDTAKLATLAPDHTTAIEAPTV